MAFILGSENILHIRRNGGVFQQVGFLTVNSFESDAQFLPTTTRANAGFKTEIPVEVSSSIGFSAIIAEDSDLTSKIGYKEIAEIRDGFERIEWKLEVFGKNFTRYGLGYFSSLSEESPIDGFISFDGSINVYGSILELEDVEPPSAPGLTLTLNPSTPTVTLDWTESTDNLAIAGYQIRKSQTGLPDEIIDLGNTLQYIDSSVEYFTFYSYNVRAYDLTGNRSNWSPKRLAFIPLPVGQPDPPDYLLFENNETILDEEGVPLIFET